MQVPARPRPAHGGVLVKEALALAVLDEHWEAQRSDWARALQDDAQPLSRLRRLFEGTEAGLRAGQQSCGTVSGCMFGNLTLELSNQTEPIRKRLQQIFDTEVEMVDKVIAEARERGDHGGDTREAARSVVAQLEGQVLFAKLYNNTQHLEALWDNCLSLLSARRTDTAAVSS
ncbi:TetR family transcriptional regulator C-terminal domain-containing protein [Streptantibioticus ferralitis]|uniref:TetR family transcriptional regulator C-terminal domain-containing protein n=1 Tax=Streptantibioticus ferralitis TaxID=236510 RepID=A0ABT5YYI2_9ACTN|nr:TetR family transcriptional regulator C-terminal domain-containing protein [Streptantibioticus ferralitis]MDF2256381.1 TetR family transcriptional regulator C-terminal domain-containing protein [Streptantibioticus ferralitis]